MAADPVALHRAARVFDAHVDTVLALEGGRPFAVRSATGHVDVPRLRAGGVDVQVFALYIEPQYKPERALARVLHLWDTLMRAVAEAGAALRVCRCSADLEAAAAAGQIAALLSVEGGEVIGTDLALLRALHALGVSAMGLTWNERNAIADGAGEDRAQGGLTGFGREVVAEMDRLGMVIDVSHLCERSFWDVLETAGGPVIASHSNARALCDHVRNLREAQIRALAAAGGVMGMNFFASFLDAEPAKADVGRVCDHIEYICGLVGPRHVGLGSDFDGIAQTPRGLEDCSRMPAITEELLRRGYADADVHLILGENFLRVFGEVWGRAAAAGVGAGRAPGSGA